MQILDQHPAIRFVLHEAYARGVPTAGTSAGTAIQSEVMILGSIDPGRIHPSAVETRSGLGLRPGMIVDQHFLKRQRQNRLISALIKHPGYIGLGVDEDAVLEITNGRTVRSLSGMGMRIRRLEKSFILSIIEP
jgi:cyanophycinase